MDDGATLRVTVVYSPAPRKVREWALVLPAGATVLQALNASGIRNEFPAVDFAVAEVGVWGRKVSSALVLRQGDRVEAYRPLRVDPKVARRERFRGQGARSAGLFAKKRPGSKPGY
ncbi:MAG: RnfH family protein [Pseudomonadota bacterium]|nr:RnfH family protein [Pseudomonadota bacterium]